MNSSQYSSDLSDADLSQHAPLKDLLSKVKFKEAELSTDVQMRYAEYGDPAGEPIVFLHGFTDSWFSFSPVLAHLDAAKYYVCMPDQRGHGNSSAPEAGYSVAEFADDAIALLDIIGLSQVTLIGHSMGSMVAQRVAVKAPKRVKRLVLIGSAANTVSDEQNEFLAVVNELTDPIPEEFAREFQTSTIHRPVTDAFIAGVIAETMKLSARVWQATLGALVTSSASSPVEQIKAPTLILWGQSDTVWPQSEQDILAARIPRAELKIYADTGHALHWEQPDQFAHDLEAFMTV
jgi:non-heme chloroperoxidase